MTDPMDAPSPPGPKGPLEEPDVPGPRVTVRRVQVQAIAQLAERASSVRVEGRGAGYVQVTLIGIEGETLDERLVNPSGSYPTKDLPPPLGL